MEQKSTETISSFQELKITESQLKESLALSLFQQITLDFYQGFFLRKRDSLFSILFTELLSFLLIAVFTLPLVIMVIQSITPQLSQFKSTQITLVTVASTAILLVLIFNVLLWKKHYKVKPFAKLLAEVENYNNIVQSLLFLEELNAVKRSDQNTPKNREEVKEVLTAIYHSLLTAIKVENLFKTHQNSLLNHSDLLIQLEKNFNTLMNREIQQATDDYGVLLHDALQVGFKIHKEVGKLQGYRSLNEPQ